MGVENGEFFLSHGGFVDGFVKYGDLFTREKNGQDSVGIGVAEN